MTLVKVNNRPDVRTWNGLFNELFSDVEKSLPLSRTGFHQPPVNIIETTEGYHAELLAPGRKKELFGIKVENNQLILSYEEEKQAVPEAWKQVRKEFNLSNFKRSFSLDDKIDTNGIQAKYEDGVLKLFLPKKPELQPTSHNITIQ